MIKFKEDINILFFASLRNRAFSIPYIPEGYAAKQLDIHATSQAEQVNLIAGTCNEMITISRSLTRNAWI